MKVYSEQLFHKKQIVRKLVCEQVSYTFCVCPSFAEITWQGTWTLDWDKILLGCAKQQSLFIQIQKQFKSGLKHSFIFLPSVPLGEKNAVA